MYKYNLPYSQIDLDEHYKPNKKAVRMLFLSRGLKIVFVFIGLCVLFSQKTFMFNLVNIVIRDHSIYDLTNSMFSLVVTLLLVLYLLSAIPARYELIGYRGFTFF